MTLPSRDTIASYGGGTPGAGYNDFSPVIDPTVDVPAAAFNTVLSNVAMLTRTAVRAWFRWAPTGTGTPTLFWHQALWASDGSGSPPVLARTSAGLYTATYPATVQDDITISTAPGFIGPVPLNMLVSGTHCEAQGTVWLPQSNVTGGNVVNIAIFNTSFTLADPNGPTFVTFCF